MTTTSNDKTKIKEAEEAFITYPARPTTGPPVDSALWRAAERRGYDDYSANIIYSAKYNGWRVLLHVPTGVCFNRKLKPLSITDEFEDAITHIQERVKDVADVLTHTEGGNPFSHGYEWLDCEGLERRHGIGRGTLIALDVPSMGDSTAEDRYTALTILFDRLSVHEKPDSNSVYVPSHFPPEAVEVINSDLYQINKEWNAEYYEGVVAVKADSKYPTQLVSAEKKTPDWVKHRWNDVDANS